MARRTRRRLGGKALVVVVIALVSIALGAGAAIAALHTINGVYHGLSSSQNCGLGCGRPVASAESLGNGMKAGMYHKRDDGGWSQQCFVGPVNVRAACAGDWGSTPCRKYAWTDAVRDSDRFVVMGWHGMNSEATLCN